MAFNNGEPVFAFSREFNVPSDIERLLLAMMYGTNPQHVLWGACFNGDENAANVAMTNWAKDININEGLSAACCGGQRGTAVLMMANGANNFDTGLNRTCLFGYKNLAELMITRGATDFAGGLTSACNGGRRDLAKLMITHGATDFDGGLYSACHGGHRELAALMIVHGATDLAGAIVHASASDTTDADRILKIREVVEFLLAHIKFLLWSRCVI